MKFKQIILPTMLLTGALAVGSIGVRIARAENDSSYSPIVQKIAQRFNLNQDEVQDVFNEVHAERHALMLSQFEDRLSSAVTQGKITDEQKKAILEKHEEMQAKMDEWRDLPFEERREKMRAYRLEIKDWAQNEGIDLEKFMFLGRMSHHNGRLMMEEKNVEIQVN